MAHRFFVEPPVQAEQVALTGQEAHHLRHVMRASVDDEIQLFDGSGREFRGRIASMKRDRVMVRVLETREVNRELPHPVVIGTALPKGDRQRWLIEKLVELGVSTVVPLQTARSVVHPDPRKPSKLHRTIIEASKQCGRNHLMQLGTLQPLDAFLDSAPEHASRWFADPSGSFLPSSLAAQQETYLAVGPEGGFTAAELDAAVAAGWQVISLGRRILRIETACLALAAQTLPVDHGRLSFEGS